MPHIQDGGAEDGQATLVGHASVTTEQLSGVRSGGGINFFQLVCQRSSLLSFSSGVQWFNIPCLPGAAYTLRLKYNPLLATSFTSLQVLWSDSGDGSAGFQGLAAYTKGADTDWVVKSTSSFSPTGTGIAIWIQTPIPGQNNRGGTWFVDDVQLEAEMAVMLSAFTIRAIINRLQSALNTEIGYVKDEANLSKDLPTVTSWYSFRRFVPDPDVTMVEVYEAGQVDFPLKERDMSLYAAGGRSRAISRLPVVIALTFANRGDASNADATLLEYEMAERGRLYGAALYRTIRNDPYCGQQKNLVVWPLSLNLFVKNDGIDDAVRRVARIEYLVRVDQQEDAINETVVGGGNLPAATFETP